MATGAGPLGDGAPSPALALAAAPVPAWPMAVVSGDGHRRMGLAEALGPGGAEVERLLDGLRSAPVEVGDDALAALAGATPAGARLLPVEVVAPAEGVERADLVEPAWLASVDGQRRHARRLLATSGRSDELEAALHVAMLVATEALDPASDDDIVAHVASGAQLWLVGAAVAWALADPEANPFAPWATLVVAGLWPIGPVDSRLVASTTGRHLRTGGSRQGTIIGGRPGSQRRR